jgi:hypothetical protein
MRVAPLSLLFVVFGNVQSAQMRDRDIEKCVACHGLASHVVGRLADTEFRANEEVHIGKRLDADGKEVPNRVIRYGDSYELFVEGC